LPPEFREPKATKSKFQRELPPRRKAQMAHAELICMDELRMRTGLGSTGKKSDE